PADDRHDFELSTQAAAKYLSEIYTTLAQASGLLVIASYNWGEHRVVSKLEQMPDPEAFEGMGRSPDERNYWRFYEEFGNRMPEQTKDYVLKIFAAAVIGSNPRLFGFDFDDPLAEHR
ncbi:MAG: transglycosylase SLT domain-containing protein, partial [Rhodothermia bacterium]|nr:transglycosylase SLT domain-containing protein [Rhodothermia bacterium]